MWQTESNELMTHEVCDAYGVQVGGVFSVLQVGQSSAQFVVHSLSAVVVPLHIQKMGNHMDGCRVESTEGRHVTAATTNTHTQS